MISISKKIIIYCGSIVAIFLLVDPFIPRATFLGFSVFAGYWAFCGAFVGVVIQEKFEEMKSIEFEIQKDAKRFNEQIKLSASLLNSVAIGFFGLAVFQKFSNSAFSFRYDSILWIGLALYFHYLGLKVLELWKAEK